MNLFNLLGNMANFVIIFWIATIIFTVVLAMKKGYSGFLAFLLGLFIPLLGSLIIIALLPDKNDRYQYSEKSTADDTGYKPLNIGSSPLGVTTPVSSHKVNTGDTWVCKKCNERNPVTSSSCKGCGEYK